MILAPIFSFIPSIFIWIISDIHRQLLLEIAQKFATLFDEI